MIFELYSWLTTPCSPPARRLGYLQEAIGIGARYRRHPRAWEPHLAASRRIITRAIAACSERRRAVVLGSGLLLDIPLAELTDGFDQVELLDMVHLRGARRVAAMHPNVALREADITGMIERLLADAAPPGSHSIGPGLPPALPEDTDLVVSANLLSQLPELPCAWLARKRRLSEEDRLALSRQIISAHIEWLAGLPATACLVTETERAYIGRDGARLQGWDALYGVTLPPADAVWSWDIAPAGEAAQGLTLRNTVHGIVDLTAARAAGRREPV